MGYALGLAGLLAFFGILIALLWRGGEEGS